MELLEQLFHFNHTLLNIFNIYTYICFERLNFLELNSKFLNRIYWIHVTRRVKIFINAEFAGYNIPYARGCGIARATTL